MREKPVDDGLSWLDELSCTCAPQDPGPDPDCVVHGHPYAKIRKVRWGWKAELAHGRSIGVECPKVIWRRTQLGIDRAAARMVSREHRRQTRLRARVTDHVIYPKE